MKQTYKNCTRDLAIHVEGPARFAAGDTIRGTVDRATRFVAPRATVTLTLHGHAKTKVNPSDRNDGCDYRSEFRLVNTPPLTLFDGPLHVEEGGEPAAWPFAFEIPRSLAQGVGLRSGEPQGVSYEPLNNPERPLPESFVVSESGFLCKVDALVEYYLEAKLSKRDTYKGWGKATTATLPIALYSPGPEPPIADFAVRRARLSKIDKFLSHRLVPGCEDMKLSAGQKMKRFFHSSDVPCLAVEYDVRVPSVIQIDNPTPIPFFLRARPRWDLTSQILQDVPQKIQIDSVHAEVSSYTEARAMGSFSAHTAEGGSKATLAGWNQGKGPPTYLPFMPDDPPLNVGELMKLKVGKGRLLGGRVYADFTAFSIRHGRHQVKWRVAVSIAGEQRQFSITNAVKILRAGREEPRSEAPPPFVASRTESWVKPPPEAEAPPAYDHMDKAQGVVAGGSSARGREVD